MELQTISQVSKNFNISTRTLRYYEQIGLLKSVKKDEYAYRTYDAGSIIRLQQIIVLRKLRIPLKQINLILRNEEKILAMEVLQSNLNEVEDEITALSAIKSILGTFISRLSESLKENVKLDLLSDDSILKIVDSLTVSKINFKEEKSMEDLNNANISKLKDVRIIYLPPAVVAASHFIGDNPEFNASIQLDKFVRESGLLQIKPDLRHYGFNHPNPIDESGDHGYEMWVTVNEDTEVPSPLIKKYFKGGLYAAHMIPMGNFNEWEWLSEWVKNSNDYEPDLSDDKGECMYGLLEEHLNYINHVKLNNTEPEGMQLDLLFPIKEKASKW